MKFITIRINVQAHTKRNSWHCYDNDRSEDCYHEVTIPSHPSNIIDCQAIADWLIEEALSDLENKQLENGEDDNG